MLASELGVSPSHDSAHGRTAGGDARALPAQGPRRGEAPATGATLDREALVRAMVATVPRARARAALRSVRRWLRVVLGAAEVHAMAFVHDVQSDRDALFDPMCDALEAAARAVFYDRERDLVLAIVAALLGETPCGYARAYGMCSPDDERRDALRGLCIVGRLLRELRASPKVPAVTTSERRAHGVALSALRSAVDALCIIELDGVVDDPDDRARVRAQIVRAVNAASGAIEHLAPAAATGGAA